MSALRPSTIAIPRRCAVYALLFFLFFNARFCHSQPQEITLYAVGDVMLGRYIAKVMAARGDEYPFKEISPVLHKADIVFGNLEAIISRDGVLPSYPKKPYNFHASKGAAHALKQAGFNVLSLANNHAMDYGPAAVRDTEKLLRDNDIAAFGAGGNIQEARRPVVITKKGVRFGFLGYGIAHARSVYAGKNKAGVAPVRIGDIVADVHALRSAVDVLIVSLHWGTEYENVPSPKQRDEARRIIDAGADLIIGHLPHVMQGIEVYKGKPIAYSLGNFIFDQKGKGTDRSFILACRFRGKTLDTVETIPMDRFKTYFPRIAAGKVQQDMLQELKKISLPLNITTPQLFKVGSMREISNAPAGK